MANRRQLYVYKGDQCANCGLSVAEMLERYGTFHRMFEFNHVEPNKKHADYDNLIRRSISKEQIDEIDKYILLCRKCHGVLHAQNVTASLDVSVNIEGKQATQTFKGQMIIDHLTKEARFLTNERNLLIPYMVQVGHEVPKLYLGRELEKDGVILTLLRDLPQTKNLAIFGFENPAIWMTATHIENNRAKIIQETRFPIFDLELFSDDDDTSILWHQNGKILTKSRGVVTDGKLEYEVDFFPI